MDLYKFLIFLKIPIISIVALHPLSFINFVILQLPPSYTIFLIL